MLCFHQKKHGGFIRKKATSSRHPFFRGRFSLFLTHHFRETFLHIPAPPAPHLFARGDAVVEADGAGSLVAAPGAGLKVSREAISHKPDISHI